MKKANSRQIAALIGTINPTLVAMSKCNCGCSCHRQKKVRVV